MFVEIYERWVGFVSEHPEFVTADGMQIQFLQVLYLFLIERSSPRVVPLGSGHSGKGESAPLESLFLYVLKDWESSICGNLFDFLYSTFSLSVKGKTTCIGDWQGLENVKLGRFMKH